MTWTALSLVALALVLHAPRDCNAADSFSFLTIGNWGDGSTTQASVATALGRAATQFNAGFVVSTGGNFLPSGVASTTDPQWASAWSGVYGAIPALASMDWRVVLGDTDHSAMGGNDVAAAQVAYHSVNAHWNCGSPSAPVTSKLQFFTFASVPVDPQHSALFVYIDTHSLITASSAEQDELYAWISEQLGNCPVDGSTNCLWLFVVGFHPLYSAGEHALSQPLQERLLPLLQRFSVDAYWSSNDRSLQHFSASRLEMFVSGSGGGGSGSVQLTGGNSANWYPAVSASGAIGSSPLRFASLSHGLTAHTVTAERMNTTFVDAAGNALYAYAAYPRRAFGTTGNAPVSAGEKAVMAMCWVFVLVSSLVITVKSYLQKRADELASKQAAAAAAVSSGHGSGSQSAIAIAGDGRFEEMAVVSSAGPTADSKDEL